jgi:hypothetical protein
VLCEMADLPEEHPLAAYRGDSRSWRFRFWSDSDKTIPFDLDGVSDIKMQARRTPGHREAITIPCEVTLPNIVVAHMSPSVSRDVPTGRYDIRATWSDGRVTTLTRGPVTIEPDVTRDD